MSKAKTLGERFEELDEELGADYDIDVIKEAFEYNNYAETIRHYEFRFIDGYSGEEGGGEQIDFLCRILNTETKEEEYYNITGFYSSWGGSEVNWNDAPKLTATEQEITIKRTLFKNAKGKVLYKLDKDIK